jgi:hypothetical protein
MIEEINTKPEDKEQKKRGRPRKYPDGWDSVKNQYFREYYKKNLIGSYICEVCGKELKVKTNMRLHLQKSKSCSFAKLKDELEQLKQSVNNSSTE